MMRRAVAPVLSTRCDGGRLIAGLVAAGVFAAVLVLLGRTDWTSLAAYPFAGVVLPDDPITLVPSSQP